MPIIAMPDRRYGVELEANPVLTMEDVALLISQQGEPVRNIGGAYEHTRNNLEWVVKGDSSCGTPGHYWGVEVCTPVLMGSESLVRVHKVTEAVTKYAKEHRLTLCNQQCGVHVHVDASNYQKSDLRKLILLYLRFERIIFGMVEAYRFESNFCKPWRKAILRGYGDVIDIFSRAKSSEQIRRAYLTHFISYCGAHSDLPRNLGLNLANFWRYGRVEFRMHEGTWNAPVVVNWTRLLVTMVEAAQKLRAVRVDGPDTLDSLFELVGWGSDDVGTNELKRFYRSRYREIQDQDLQSDGVQAPRLRGVSFVDGTHSGLRTFGGEDF